MSEEAIKFRQKATFLQTLRSDKWWLEPLLVLLGLGAFVVYATWGAFQGVNYWYSAGVEGFGGYLSPFYSPLVYVQEGVDGGASLSHALLGSWPEWWPSFIPVSPAFFILVFPLSFRFTCYYYRGAYYKAFAGSPPACAVGAIPQKSFRGETFLLVFQNLHRIAFYFAVLFIPILYYDAFMSFFRGGEFGIGLGSIILLINPTLLGMYTFGCHSWRHLIGGRKDCFSCTSSGKLRYGVYKKSSWLNRRHKMFAWFSLVWVGFTDFYVRMVASGTFTDPSTW